MKMPRFASRARLAGPVLPRLLDPRGGVSLSADTRPQAQPWVAQCEQLCRENHADDPQKLQECLNYCWTQ
jgi:hypothetical protein